MATWELGYVGEDDAHFFRRVHGRWLNATNERYMLPADEDEVRVSSLSHIYSGRQIEQPRARSARNFTIVSSNSYSAARTTSVLCKRFSSTEDHVKCSIWVLAGALGEEFYLILLFTLVDQQGMYPQGDRNGRRVSTCGGDRSGSCTHSAQVGQLARSPALTSDHHPHLQDRPSKLHVRSDRCPGPLHSEPPDRFELYDLDEGDLPYPNNHFDLIHARSVHTGVRPTS
jgi:hypothetical protein